MRCAIYAAVAAAAAAVCVWGRVCACVCACVCVCVGSGARLRPLRLLQAAGPRDTSALPGPGRLACTTCICRAPCCSGQLAAAGIRIPSHTVSPHGPHNVVWSKSAITFLYVGQRQIKPKIGWTPHIAKLLKCGSHTDLPKPRAPNSNNPGRASPPPEPGACGMTRDGGPAVKPGRFEIHVRHPLRARVHSMAQGAPTWIISC